MAKFLAVDPGERIRLDLPMYTDKTDPPIVTAKYMTARERRRFYALLSGIDGKDEDADDKAFLEMLRLAGVDLPGHDLTAWMDVLTDAEAHEILRQVLAANSLTGDQRKNSESPSRSDTGSSVRKDAGAGAGSNSHAETVAAS